MAKRKMPSNREYIPDQIGGGGNSGTIAKKSAMNKKTKQDIALTLPEVDIARGRKSMVRKGMNSESRPY